MDMLDITLLGAFRVMIGNEPITNFPTDATRALLVYLVLDAGRVHSRAELGSLLWPEQPESTVLNNLRQTLIRLRRVIQDEDADPAWLDITRQTIRFNAESAYQLDVTRFQALVTETESHAHRRVIACPHCIHKLEEAVRLYRGDFMTGFDLDSVPFEEWLLLQREYLHRQAMTALYHLATYARRCGDSARVQEYARQQLALEPWCEEAHGQLMYALALSGQRSAALAQYETCQRSLAEELGVEPAPETRALYQRIRSGAFTIEDAPTHNLPIPLTSFVGRETELEQLRAWLPAPTSRLISIVGASGMGKSRLALAVAREMVGCFAHGVWFVPLSEGVGDTDLAQGREGSVAGAIAAALDIAAPLFSRGRDFERRVLTALADQELLLVLDNLEPERRASNAPFLLQLLQQAPDVVVLVTATRRLKFQMERVLYVTGMATPESAGDPHAAELGCVRLFVERAQNVVGTFSLDATTLPAVTRICRAVAGNPLGVELATVWLTHFSPLQIARAIERDIAQLTTQAWDIPARHQSLWAVFAGTWRSLLPLEQEVLAQLTIFREGFSREAAEVVVVVRDAHRSSGQAVVQAIETLHRRSLLCRTDGGRYTLHELLYQYARRQLEEQGASPLARLSERHSTFYLTLLGRCAAMYASSEAVEANQSIAQDWANIQAAWDWAVRHGHVGVLDVALDGLRWYMYCRGLIEEAESTFGVAVWRLQARLGTAQSSTARLERALRRLCARLLVAQANFRNMLGQYDRTRMALESARELLSESGAQQIQVESQLYWANSRWPQADYGDACEHLDQVLSLAKEGSWLVAEALSVLSIVAARQSDFNRAQQLAAQSLMRYKKLGNFCGESIVLNVLGDLAIRRQAYTEAADYLERGLRLSLLLGGGFHEQTIRLNLARLWMQYGNYTDALRGFERALQQFQGHGTRRAEGLAWCGIGHVALRIGDFERAQQALEQALHISRELNERELECEVLGLLANLACQWGRPQMASGYCMRAVQSAQALGNRALRCQLAVYLGHTWRLLRQTQRAHEVYQQALDLHEEIGYPLPNVDSLAGLAAIAQMEGDLTTALRYVEVILAAQAKDPALTASENPGEVFLITIQVLEARHDPRAAAVSAAAQAWVQQRAVNIDDRALRQQFMEQVPAHRDIMGRA